MEGLGKRIQIVFFLFLILLNFPCFSQIGIQNNVISEKIRFPLWAQLDAYPGIEIDENQNNNVFSYAISRLKETAPFFAEGIICGWKFSYTPSDKTRNVKEFFEFTPIYDFSTVGKISYENPWIDENRLYCWVEFECSPQITSWLKQWHSSKYNKISGKGYGLLSDGFDGIKDASAEALKNAIRSYARSITKNKPKEIIGEVIISKNPGLGIQSGRYVVSLDFFLNISRILCYSIY